jgi:choice-of-anchor B domain-containing protein
MTHRSILLGLIALTWLHPAHSQNRHVTPCVAGNAGGFACNKVDLHANVPLADLSAGADNGNDIWGWTDPVTHTEYALVGLDNGTAFVDLSQPDHPVVIGHLPTQSSNSLWRDMKVYADHAFIVSEAADHGMQVFDLTRLRDVATPPAAFTADAVYDGFGRAHNVAINEDSGFAYAVGSRQGTTQCNSGLHMIDISTPTQPVFAGCYSDDGYTHDTQCVNYTGPDADFSGREICFSSNEDTLTIVDVTVKSAPALLSRTGYSGSAYTHQGWLTPDQRWFLVDDELDETNFGHNTRTYVWDITDLTAPQQSFAYTGPVGSIDHNLYIRDHYAYLSNYRSGLRIVDLAGIDQSQIEEAAFFDTYPENDTTGFDGAWSNYPFFESGLVVIGDINRGLFVVEPQLCTAPSAPEELSATPAGDQRIDLAWNVSGEPGTRYEVYRELGGCSNGPGALIAGGLESPTFSDLTASGQVDYGYRIRAVASSGECGSAFSSCVIAQTTGACTAPPSFSGLTEAVTGQGANCQVALSWPSASVNCEGPAAYDLHRGTESDFVPGPDTVIVENTQAISEIDTSVLPEVEYTYLVRARDQTNGGEDDNDVRLSVTPEGPPGDGNWMSGAEDGDPILNGGNGGEGPALRHVAWHVVDDVAHSGSRSYYSGYVDGECIGLTSASLMITPGETAELRFHTRFGIEDGWDGGVVQISTDDGSTWQSLMPDGGYPGTIQDEGNACDLPVGTGVFSGTSLSWTQETFPLTDFDGEIKLRWLFASDTAVTEEGWWLDDIVISHVLVPGMCTLTGDVVFADGFEQTPSP